MSNASGTSRHRLGHLLRQALLLGGGTFFALALFPLTVTVASAAAIPFAGLVLLSRPKEPREFALLAGSITVAVWWLTGGAELPGQLMRAAALLSGVAFVAFTVLTRLTMVHRTLAALAVSVLAATGLLMFLRTSWSELSWWVQFRVGLATRAVIGAIWAGEEAGVALQISDPSQLQGWLESMVGLAGDLFPAVVALTVGVATYVAIAVYRRAVRQPLGQMPGRLAEFRFSEHLGWLAVVAMTIVVVPKFLVLKTTALNVLVVWATLYAIRGVAVFVFFLEVVGGGGILLSLLLAIVIFVMLPVVVGSAVVVGVLDTGLDFRRRWMTKPPTGE